MIDVFVSYAGEDAARARTPAGKFIGVFFDEWDVLPGDVVPHRPDKAIRDSMACVTVVSPALFRSPRTMEEHAALMGRGVRFIPVLIGDAEPPESAAPADPSRAGRLRVLSRRCGFMFHRHQRLHCRSMADHEAVPRLLGAQEKAPAPTSAGDRQPVTNRNHQLALKPPDDRLSFSLT
ncbi:toll/interleukin-1 receptor domain-containing protein [Nonomuraea sp. NPDC052116]|uniref:toll/interleukin-1 receptor domain-containing protein n=1 Tax=Nonomuraea sp. NPDC052116 TaxID=3155665 RepID=UPI00341D678A